MTFAFDSDTLPQSPVTRTGKRTLKVLLPMGIWSREARPDARDLPGSLVKSIATTDNGVEITTSTDAFGYIRVPAQGKSEFVLQVYADSIGARWRSPDAPPARQAATPAPAPAVQAPAASASAPAAEPMVPSAADVARNLSTVRPDQPRPAGGEADLPPEIPSAERKPFFAVPYSVRNEVQTPADQAPVSQAADQAPAAQAPGVRTAAAPAEAVTGDYPPASELRFKAVNKSAEDVKFAELAGDAGGSAPVVAPLDVASGPVGEPATRQAVTPLPQPAGPEPQPAPEAPVQESPSPGQMVGSVTPPPAESAGRDGTPMMAEVPAPDEVSGQGQVSGAVAPPPPPVSGPGQAGGAVSPPPAETQPAPETPQTAAPAPEPAQPAEPAPGQPVQTAEAPSPEPAQPADEQSVPDQPASDQGGQPGADGQAEKKLTPEEQEKARMQAIRDQLYEAQSMMFNGALDDALPIYEDLLKQPKLPDDVREETLYAIADIKRQLDAGDLSNKFDEVAQAYIQAMNANLRSSRVPRALLNLGLLNLQVGNFPEARAYFKILQDKYPEDDNIPAISYYWGEYWYRKGDYKKAADQFQYLIQTYPEHQLAKQAAYYLADSLNRLGYLDQAFQIVDYIDKRWPDYYMENMEFLRLAGGVEMQLKKWDQAKNHYFTYYNLNPEADGADVVLARIGDIYLRKNEKDPAKQVYEKAVKNYPDKEGGLISKMRLAEEGIYDDPGMSEMVDVFNRPYNLNPKRVYTEIVSRHPDSPLAPIAQLKLAMWYAFNKKYPEALTAAQDLIEKYPDSPLVDKARTLGDSVFVRAVPGMLAEQRYGRIVRYWETYDFIGKKDSKVDDNTKLAIATSYWKIGQPDKALDLLKPYLTRKQIPGVSDQALGLAVNIYLDQLAWQDINDLVNMASRNWKLEPGQKRQVDYARAMALQNMGDGKRAVTLWADLAKDTTVDPAFRAYAMYYMAKDAMERQDLRRVFVYAQEALSLLLQTNGDPEKIKDAVLMSIYATERSGRYEEALKWAKEYDKYISPDNPEWASTRFKLARIYRKAGAMDEWKQLLQDIIDKKPDSLQAQLAKSALDTYELEQKASEYAPNPG
ncbi:Outer membrane protein assembly factor BamD [Pseudodesulfovibrio hydrargyri]|uniref:Outer membrane protein assembly factor BamD n=1 Tax=Pseudodesulfovibrio hydrargyri TaxID=2125990 RepID=A0A1J5MXU2_9BACT|nr:tetratricopeptide repeat protein [Pseudodesulfovibrio hydrargyri]OIQ51349.1 Outer membrane protein assembly factor BamD [Pseudodesulfovibrio hydrargyri]